MSVKIQNAVEFGKYFKFVLQMEQVTPQTPTKNAYVVLMFEAGRLIWPEKYKIARKINRQKLHNNLIKLLQEKNVGWTKQNFLSKGRPFVLQLTDILWRLDGHHGKLSTQACPIPEFFRSFKNIMCQRATSEKDQILNVNLFLLCLNNFSMCYNK